MRDALLALACALAALAVWTIVLVALEPQTEWPRNLIVTWPETWK